MFRKFRSVLSIALAVVMACSLFATMALVEPATQVDAAGKAVPLSATRYRYPMIRLENAKFRNGVPIDDNTATSPYLGTGKKTNGKDPTDIVYAHVEEYDMFNMKLGKNKAFFVTNKDNTSNVADNDYMGYKHHFGKEVDTREDILPASIQGIPIKATDHGIMMHVEVRGLPGHLEDGFCHLGTDSDGNLTGDSAKHVPCYANITFQEWDYKPDGTPKKKKGKVVQTAMNVKPGAQVTFIWTKQIDWVNPDNGKQQAEWAWDNTEYDVDETGKAKQVKNEDGTVSFKRRLKPDRHYKPGDTQVITMPTYTYDGKVADSGAVEFPADFCGYVIVPFSEFQLCWSSHDYDGFLNFKKMELCDFNFSAYWHYRGEIVFDELSFYGPTFAKVDGAYDYGNLNINNHRDSMINRKRITVKEEKPSEKPSVEAPSEIKKDVTLTNKDTGIVIEAPSSAKLDSKAVFNVTVVDPDADDYNKQLYTNLFGADRSKFKAYTLFLGEDGDQEPADFVQINFPVPEGLDASACKVYNLSTTTEVEKLEVESTLSADKKTISVKSDHLGLFIIAVTGDGSATEEVTSEATEDASTGDTPVEAVSKENEQTSENKENAKSANLTWLWIVLGVLVAGGIAVAVVLVVKKGKKVETDDADDADHTSEE